jgi:ABC-type multidrug transport system permease subunit
MMVNLIIALIFASTYSNTKYNNDVDVISSVALIYITVMFTGVVGCNSIQPVIYEERPAFYREQFSEIYDVKIYTLCSTLVEIPYLIVSALVFLVPYFYIVGFDNSGDGQDKFLWYWLFQVFVYDIFLFVGGIIFLTTACFRHYSRLSWCFWVSFSLWRSPTRRHVLVCFVKYSTCIIV